MKGKDARTGQFTKGHAKLGGRAPGTPNKVTTETKRLLEQLVLHGLTLAKKDYDRLRRKFPGSALRALSRFLEYEQAKLSRVEQVGPDGGPIVVERRIIEVREAAPKEK